MTILQILNSLFYLLIYPYLIRTLGADSYGTYIFAYSIVTYCISVIGFGLDMPGVKAIAKNQKNREVKETTLSCIFTAKMYIEIGMALVFFILVMTIPLLQDKKMLLFICFTQTLTNIFFPQWYFQGMQKMKIVTGIQLVFKLLSLPAIFLLVHKPDDVILFTLISSLASVAGGIAAAFYVRYNEKMKITWKPFSEIKIWYKDAFPFFLNTSTTTIKDQSIAVIIGAVFSMKDVALYDLANKIVMLPRLLSISVNNALFPKIMANTRRDSIKKIFRYELVAGLIVIAGVALLGRLAIKILGGEQMLGAYPIAVILSVTIVTWLIVGAFVYFIFVPQNKYKLVSINQFIALLSFLLYTLIGLQIEKSVLVLSIAIALSGLTEVVYCLIISKKKKLMQTIETDNTQQEDKL